MKQVLWINSCMRGAGQSRTLELCRTFLEELRVRRPGLKVAERDLTRAELPVMTAVTKGADGIYACAGYNVGSVELMRKLLAEQEN